MNNGFLIYAVGEKYLKQAILACLSIKQTKNSFPVSIITTENTYFTENFYRIFDKIIFVKDTDDKDRYQCINRSLMYRLSPYENSIVIDSDVLFLESLDNLWPQLITNYSFYYPSVVYTYRGEILTSDFYRKVFTSNKLKNIYTGIYFFKKNRESKNFYEILEMVVTEWKKFYKIFLDKNFPKHPSMDVATSITHHIVNFNQYHNDKNIFKFIHMKPKAQNWQLDCNSWIDVLNYYVTDKYELFVGNFMQKGIFHYVDDNFDIDKLINHYSKDII